MLTSRNTSRLARAPTKLKCTTRQGFATVTDSVPQSTHDAPTKTEHDIPRGLIIPRQHLPPKPRLQHGMSIHAKIQAPHSEVSLTSGNRTLPVTFHPTSMRRNRGLENLAVSNLLQSILDYPTSSLKKTNAVTNEKEVVGKPSEVGVEPSEDEAKAKMEPRRVLEQLIALFSRQKEAETEVGKGRAELAPKQRKKQRKKLNKKLRVMDARAAAILAAIPKTTIPPHLELAGNSKKAGVFGTSGWDKTKAGTPMSVFKHQESAWAHEGGFLFCFSRYRSRLS